MWIACLSYPSSLIVCMLLEWAQSCKRNERLFDTCKVEAPETKVEPNQDHPCRVAISSTMECVLVDELYRAGSELSVGNRCLYLRSLLS
jgi:hypothetical protein